VALDCLAVDGHLLLQQHRDLARAVERAGGVELVDAPFDVQLFRRGRQRLVV
jgi:hypothetical protein